jgi:hypothetical protein
VPTVTADEHAELSGAPCTSLAWSVRHQLLVSVRYINRKALAALPSLDTAVWWVVVSARRTHAETLNDLAVSSAVTVLVAHAPGPPLVRSKAVPLLPSRRRSAAQPWSGAAGSQISGVSPPAAGLASARAAPSPLPG